MLIISSFEGNNLSYRFFLILLQYKTQRRDSISVQQPPFVAAFIPQTFANSERNIEHAEIGIACKVNLVSRFTLPTPEVFGRPVITEARHLQCLTGQRWLLCACWGNVTTPKTSWAAVCSWLAKNTEKIFKHLLFLQSVDEQCMDKKKQLAFRSEAHACLDPVTKKHGEDMAQGLCQINLCPATPKRYLRTFKMQVTSAVLRRTSQLAGTHQSS